MPDEPVAEEGPLGAGDELHEVALDFLGRGFFRQAEALGEPGDVGVHDDADVQAKGVAEDDVGGFAPDSSERGEGVHGARDFAAVALNEGGAAGADVFRFGAEEAGRFDEILKLFGGQHGVVGGGAAGAEEGGRGEVHALVGALRGEDGGDEKLERRGVIQLAVRGGVGAREGGGDGGGALGPGHFFGGAGVAVGGPSRWSFSLALGTNSDSGYLSTRSL